MVPETKPEVKIEPTADDLKITHLVLAVHGIGNQFRYSTIHLWWLSAMLFDLVYIWHRFICSYRTTAKILRTLRVRHKAAQEAEKKA